MVNSDPWEENNIVRSYLSSGIINIDYIKFCRWTNQDLSNMVWITSRGWNWSSKKIESYMRKLNLGIEILESGSTKITDHMMTCCEMHNYIYFIFFIWCKCIYSIMISGGWVYELLTKICISYEWSVDIIEVPLTKFTYVSIKRSLSMRSLFSKTFIKITQFIMCWLFKLMLTS